MNKKSIVYSLVLTIIILFFGTGLFEGGVVQAEKSERDLETEKFMKEQGEYIENLDKVDEKNKEAKKKGEKTKPVELEDVKIESSEDEDTSNVKLLGGVEESEVIAIHQKLDHILHIDRGLFVQDITRSVGWAGVKGLVWINDYLEDGVNGIITLDGFYEQEGVKSLIKKLTPFAFGLFFISIILLGYQFMVNKIDKREEVAMNVLLAFSMILIIPNLLPYLDKVTQLGVSEISSKNESLSTTMIKMNVADVKYYVENDFSTGGKNGLPIPLDKSVGKGKQKGTSDYTKGNLLGTEGTNLAISEKLDLQSEESFFGWFNTGYKKELADNNKVAHDVLMTQTVPTGKGDEVRLKKLASNTIPTTQIGQESYYRYHVNWFSLVFTLLVTSVALAITVVKMARVMFDIGFHSIFSMFIAATDLTGGQRMKKMIVEISSSFGVLFVMVLILKLFLFYANWVTGLTSSVGWVIALLMLIAGAWALMDAPDIVQRLLGIDAGLRSGHGALMGAYAGSKMLGGAVKGGMNMASKGVGLAKGAGAGARGLAGMQKPMPKSSGGNGGGGNPPPPNGGGGDGGGQPPIPPNGGGGDGGGQPPIPPNGGGGDGGGQPPIPPNGDDGGGQPPIPKMSDGSQGQGGDPYHISKHDNPYQKNTIMGGSQRGQARADSTARAYNSGVAMRRRIGKATAVAGGIGAGVSRGISRSVGAVAMTGAKAVRSPIKSYDNVGRMAHAKGMEIKSKATSGISTTGTNVVSSVQSTATQASNFVGGIANEINVPIGGNIPQPILNESGIRPMQPLVSQSNPEQANKLSNQSITSGSVSKLSNPVQASGSVKQATKKSFSPSRQSITNGSFSKVSKPVQPRSKGLNKNTSKHFKK